ncbi:MAG: nucleotidyltransferase family protein [Dechloromonas sp.]|nr:nucleotidyltransferase family protein [Dechloromonas sp.]
MKSNDTLWRKAVLTADATMQAVIRNMNMSTLRIALVVNEQGVLVGTICDGDIRRGLLRGLDLNSSIESLIHRGPLVVPPTMGRDMVLQLMVANKVLQIPVVDDQQRIVGLHLWDEITTTSERSNLLVIMAGGKGTRLRPLTDSCPKSLVKVVGKPMLEHIIERGKVEGFTHFILAIHYLGHMIEEHFGDGSRLGVKIKYLREDKPLGTAGALGLLRPAPDEPFIVTNGDVVTDIRYGDLLDFHTHHVAAATMAVRVHEWQHPYGVVQTRGVDIVGFEEKPIARTRINAGVYVLSPEALEELADGTHCDMPTLFERLQARSMRTVAYPMHEPWLDVGRAEDLERARRTIFSAGNGGKA